MRACNRELPADVVKRNSQRSECCDSGGGHAGPSAARHRRTDLRFVQGLISDLLREFTLETTLEARVQKKLRNFLLYDLETIIY